MSDNSMSNSEVVEQITKTPSDVASKREKDPKRVAAGKKLAENNKRMREENARYKALEAQMETESPPETKTEGNVSGEWFPNLSLTNVISLVGIGLAVYNVFIRLREKQGQSLEDVTSTEGRVMNSRHRGTSHVAWREPVSTHIEEPEVKPNRKFGM